MGWIHAEDADSGYVGSAGHIECPLAYNCAKTFSAWNDAKAAKRKAVASFLKVKKPARLEAAQNEYADAEISQTSCPGWAASIVHNYQTAVEQAEAQAIEDFMDSDIAESIIGTLVAAHAAHEAAREAQSVAKAAHEAAHEAAHADLNNVIKLVDSIRQEWLAGNCAEITHVILARNVLKDYDQELSIRSGRSNRNGESIYVDMQSMWMHSIKIITSRGGDVFYIEKNDSGEVVIVKK